MRICSEIIYLSFILLGLKLSGCAADVCFPYIGCFTQKYPWTSINRPFPEPEDPQHNNVSLIFFSREQTDGEWLDIYPDITFNVTGFKPDRPVVTITHGFSSSAQVEWVMRMKDKYLENVDANIFLVNWELGASGINYFQCAANTRVVGAILGRFGRYLIEQEGVKYSDFHLIGHSLGAHISAYAANVMNNASTSGEKVFRITGLDAAQPGYQNEPAEVRISKDKAVFVETIHSDGKPFLPFFGFGYVTDLGHLDIYINWGYNQPRCVDISPIFNLTDINQLANVTVDVISNAISCSHGRSYEIFISSIDKSVPCEFIGHRIITILPATSNQRSCGLNGKDCIKLGLDTPNQTPRGAFQVETSGVRPFCCYNYTSLLGCRSSPNKTTIFG